MPDETLQAAISEAVKRAADPGSGMTTIYNNNPPGKYAPLAGPPTPAPPLQQPTGLKHIFGYKPTTTLGSQVGRWYENAGGLNNAISGAQQAQQNRAPGVLNKNTWPTWKPSDVLQRQVPVFESKPTDQEEKGFGGYYTADSGNIWLNKSHLAAHPEQRPAILEHELSHAAYMRDAPTRNRAEASASIEPDNQTKPDPNWNVPNLSATKPTSTPNVRARITSPAAIQKNTYALTPTETDVRLAEIKRRYAHHTGQLVNTPEDAEKAWNWWRTNQNRFYVNSAGSPLPTYLGSSQDPSPPDQNWLEQNNRRMNPDNEPVTLEPDTFKLYDALPAEQKQQLFHRMPELVQQPNQAVQKFGASMKQAAAPFDINKRQVIPAAPGASPPTLFKPPVMSGTNSIDSIGKTHNAWQRWLDQNYGGVAGTGPSRANVHTALSNQLQAAGPAAEQQYKTHLQQTVYPKAMAPHQKYQFTPKPDLPNSSSFVNEYETDWNKPRWGKQPDPTLGPPPPAELTLGLQEGAPKPPYDKMLFPGFKPAPTDNTEISLAHELEHVNQDLPRAGEPDNAARLFENAGQQLSPYDKSVIRDVDRWSSGNNFRDTLFQTQTEPGAVFTELAHAADGAQAATGQKPQGEMQLVPDGPAGGYSLPTEDILREARRSGVLSGKRTSTEMLNTPAGQAWMRMQYDKLNTNQPPATDAYADHLEQVTSRLQSEWPEKEDIHNQHYDYLRGRQQEYWNDLSPEMQQDVLKRQPGVLMPQQLEKMPFERKPWHTTPAVPRNNWNEKSSELKPEIILQPHQQRVADRVSGPNPRMLVYHGLGTGKSLAAIAAAEAAKKNSGGEYAIVAPASLRDNFRKEIDKFTTGSNPDILSYTGLGLGQTPKNNPETLIFDEAHRLRNPEGLAAQAATEAAQKVPRVVLLTGSPITNEPSDLANLMSILRNEKITPESFENKYVQYKKVKPGWGGWLRGVKPGEEADVKNPEELKSKLRGHVDFNPGKSPEGVNINQQIIDAPMSDEQERIQKAIRTKIPPRFLWKLDKEFPLSRDELSKLNSFLTGMRQISLSTQPFRADKDYYKAFEQSGKLQTALSKLRETLDSDPRKKALIYSNYIDAGLQPYAAALAKNKIPHAIFHGGVPVSERRKALDEYNAGKLRALLIGPAGAEGISTKGTNLIQLLDPHWNETRSQQAQGRGLRFDSHMDLPEELKNVAVQRFISRAKEPGWFKKHILGAQKVRTGDEILDTLAKEKEKANEKFRAILKQVGSESHKEEVARKLYQENVPEEQQRKAAGLAWASMRN